MGLTKRPDKKRGRVQLATFREGASRIRLYDLLSFNFRVLGREILISVKIS